MKSHQRYFPLFDKNNKLLPNFITISNMNLNENNIRTGNETVLRARLEDAMFFYKEDLKEPFENKIEKLKRVTYFEEIGSIYDKTKRISKIAQKLNSLYNLEEKEVLRASSLCKADLVTNLVKEFTELQGEIGYYYSLKTNESENIAYAIKEQYLPTGNNDNAPSQPLSQIINFSDKLDNLVSCFALGKIPTGSKDPFSLRRQCLGIIRTCDKYKIGLNFNEMINASYDILIEQKKLTSNKEETLDKIREFFSQRLKNELLDRGFKHDLVDSILDTHYYLSDLYATQEKLRVLANWEKEEASKNVSMAFARVIRIAKEKTNNEIDVNLFEKEEEKNLYNAFRLVKPDFEHHFNKKDFHSCLIILQNLVSPINNFFDNVMIMVEDKDIKNNRLALLNEVKEMSLKIANMDKIIL